MPEVEKQNLGFLLREGEAPPEYDPNSNYAELSGKFDPQCQYGAWCNLTGDDEIDRRKVTELLSVMVDFVPFEGLSRVELIFHPLGTAGTGFLEDGCKSTFAWKYMPLPKRGT